VIKWIKFSERQPEERGSYLYSVDGEFVRVLTWSETDKHFWDTRSDEDFAQDDPEFWAEINPPIEPLP
jgi:hypothetical protein